MVEPQVFSKPQEFQTIRPWGQQVLEQQRGGLSPNFWINFLGVISQKIFGVTPFWLPRAQVVVYKLSSPSLSSPLSLYRWLILSHGLFPSVGEENNFPSIFLRFLAEIPL